MFTRPRCCPPPTLTSEKYASRNFSKFQNRSSSFWVIIFFRKISLKECQISTCHDLLFFIHINITLIWSNDQLYIFYRFIRLFFFKLPNFPILRSAINTLLILYKQSWDLLLWILWNIKKTNVFFLLLLCAQFWSDFNFLYTKM